MRVKLEDVCERGSSNVKQSDIPKNKGLYEIYGASGLAGKVDFYHRDKPYVAVVKDGAGIGRTMFLHGKTSVIGTLQYLIPKDNILPKYLYYVVKYMNLSKYFTGATIPHIYYRDYKNEEFNLSSIDDQKTIVNQLEALECIIELRTEDLKKLDELVKARFVEMFKDCIESVKLEQVVTSIKTGKLDANAEKKDGKYPFFTCDATPKRIDDYVFDTEAILISGNGSRVGHVHYYKGKFNAYQRTYVLSDFRHDVDLSYLKTYLENELRPYIARNKKGSAVPYITLPMLQNFKLPFPPLEKQKEFATFVAQVDKSKFTLSNELAMGNFYIRLIHDCIMHGCIDLRVPQ